mmetsp:Transcript_7486/g.19253  ORF Transcript_7486/g.19253 Transcript_7486/m.19253 type:complete len:203 (-) Transcript_7486:751-1359(-)
MRARSQLLRCCCAFQSRFTLVSVSHLAAAAASAPSASLPAVFFCAFMRSTSRLLPGSAAAIASTPTGPIALRPRLTSRRRLLCDRASSANAAAKSSPIPTPANSSFETELCPSFSQKMRACQSGFICLNSDESFKVSVVIEASSGNDFIIFCRSDNFSTKVPSITAVACRSRRTRSLLAWSTFSSRSCIVRSRMSTVHVVVT